MWPPRDQPTTVGRSPVQNIEKSADNSRVSRQAVSNFRPMCVFRIPVSGQVGGQHRMAAISRQRHLVQPNRFRRGISVEENDRITSCIRDDSRDGLAGDVQHAGAQCRTARSVALSALNFLQFCGDFDHAPRPPTSGADC